MDTARIIRMLISSLVNGLLGSASVILTVVTQGDQIQNATVTLAIVSGAVLMLKDIQAYLSQPPNLGGH